MSLSWAGIFLVRVPSGVTPRQAIDATAVAWLANPAVSGSHLVAVPDEVTIESDPEWAPLARDVLHRVNPNLVKVDDSGWLDDRVGPVYIGVSGSEVQLRPKKFWENPDDMDGFAMMWSYCTALAEATGCVAHDSDEDLLINLSLDVETARSFYNWI